jgi:hypothetical protein
MHVSGKYSQPSLFNKDLLMHAAARAVVISIALSLINTDDGRGQGVPHQVVRVTEESARGPAEVAVAINPKNPDHIVAVSMQGDKGGKKPTTNFVYVSTDFGKSWKTAAAPNPHNRTQGDDAITIAADGTVYRSYISFLGLRLPKPARAASGIFTSSSPDGITWSDPVPVVDHVNTYTPFEDKPWIAVDTAADSKFKGNVYVAWTKFDVYGSKDPAHKSHIYFSRSKDGGKTYAMPFRISQEPGDALDRSNTLEGAVPAIGPKGEIHITWAGPRGLVATRSLDGGNTFAKEKVIAEVVGGWNLPAAGFSRQNGLPVTAVDRSTGKNRGSVYVCWIDQRNKDPDVFVIASRDGGMTWGEPVRVNDDPKGNGKVQAFAWMAVDPVDGSVNVVFYDRRDLEGTLTSLYVARSVDGGRTFVNHKVDQEPFSPGGRFLGDYNGIDAHSGRVVALYAHVVAKKQIALSAALFRFRPGTQESADKKQPKSSAPGRVGGPHIALNSVSSFAAMRAS